jgi:nucleoside phosphorylase
VKESYYIEKEKKDVQHLYDRDLILLVTATDLETEITHQKLSPLSGYNKIIKVFEGDLTIYLGCFGNYKIAHVQSSMGSISRDSSIMTVSNALIKTNSKIVVMVGIAFGANEENQNIGDVLISESIIPYNLKRIGKTTITRGIEAPSSKILLNRFKNIKTTWEYFLSENKKAQLFPTRILSGEELIDNIKYRNKLLKRHPESKGGEMEGAGVFSACDTKANWIIVKGICDFADGNKSEKKEERQTIAINSALSACLEVFNSFSAFNELDVSPYIPEKNDTPETEFKTNEVLFDIYDNSKEPYYIEREEDKHFIPIINQFSIWISGPTGCGKSNLILRNLIYSKLDFIQISLAACIGLNIDSIFKEILYEISSQTKSRTQIQPKSFPECSKAIIEILKEKYANKDLYIFIEEIPLGSEPQFKDFSDKIFSLLISKNLAGSLDNIRFVLSSINSPIDSIKLYQHKVHQQLSFLSLEYWQVPDIISLINMIEETLHFQLPSDIKDDLVKVSGGSPRFIKKYFRSLFTISKKDRDTLRFILKETQRELFLKNYV